MEGSTDKIARMQAGGSCANVLTILSYLGWQSYPVARMNGDAAARFVRSDLQRWGVRLALGELGEGVETPVVIQRTETNHHGSVAHRFSLRCPSCGAWLPGYRGITIESADAACRKVTSASVFYLDRASPGAIRLAAAYRRRGAVVVFEPSGFGNARLFADALSVTDILKYSSERLRATDLRGLPSDGVLLQVETRGPEGLRYLSRLGGTPRWRSVSALEAPRFADAAGAGDWCTAGILHYLAQAGQRGFRRSRDERVQRALRMGQALASWNCGYVGARGGMYEASQDAFVKAIEAILAQQGDLPSPDGGVRPQRANVVTNVKRFCSRC